MRKVILVISAALLCLASSTFSAEPGERIGPVVLTTFDGRNLTMSNYAERTATTILFLSTRCEATRAAIEEINGLNAKYRLRGVLLVGILSPAAADSEEVRSFAQTAGFAFPVYRDPAGTAALQLGARVTPEAFLLDNGGIIRYRGSVLSLGSGIAQLLAGQPVQPDHIPAEGTPIGRTGAKRQVDDPYGFISFSSELIFEKIAGAPAHHASTIAEAANGDLLVVWYGGSYESSDDQTLFLSRRGKGERRWTAPEALVRNSLHPPGNAVVFRDPSNRVWIVWARMEASRPLRRGGGWGNVRIMFRVSGDNGATWSPDQPLNAGVEGLPRNPPVVSATSGILLPLAGTVDGELASFFLQSLDNGRSWRRSGVAKGGGQPALVERKDGSFLVLMRKHPRALRSESHDGGLTWSPGKATELRNPESGLSMTALANGHLIVVFNDSETRRTPLNIARSADGGKTWEDSRALETNPGEYSYPCVIQSSDGKIHVTYTFRRYSIKHVELNEDWLVRIERPN